MCMGSITFTQGKGSQYHNRREYEKNGKEFPEHIDKRRFSENIIISDKDIKEAYKEFFGEAVERYNNKQTRADRKINDYLEHIKKSKNGEKPFYEDILQWGKMEDFQNNPELRETAKKCLIEYAKTFEERNPNLKLIGTYIHMDEASPHMHIDYVPVAHGYKRGLDTRNGLDKAMKEMGFAPSKESRTNNATSLWREREREYFKDICLAHGLEVDQEKGARGHTFSPEEYKAIKDEIKDKALTDVLEEKIYLEAENKALEERNEQMYQTHSEEENRLNKELQDLQGEVKKAEELKIAEVDKNIFGKPKDTIEVPYKDYKDLVATAKAVDDAKALQEEYQEKMYNVNMQRHSLDKKEKTLKQKENYLSHYEKDLANVIADNQNFKQQFLEWLHKKEPKISQWLEKAFAKFDEILQKQMQDLSKDIEALEDLEEDIDVLER